MPKSKSSFYSALMKSTFIALVPCMVWGFYLYSGIYKLAIVSTILHGVPEYVYEKVTPWISWDELHVNEKSYLNESKVYFFSSFQEQCQYRRGLIHHTFYWVDAFYCRIPDSGYERYIGDLSILSPDHFRIWQSLALVFSITIFTLLIIRWIYIRLVRRQTPEDNPSSQGS